MSFYRIYRPKVLDEIDNATVRHTVELLLTKPKTELPHAYLLVGPRGTGKTTTARVIAKLFNCEHPTKSGAPCGSCGPCKAIAGGRHLDVMEIDAASNTGVDNIRDLRDRVALAPAQAVWKIYIIDEVHMLSTGAFNALLKTLEEPPTHAIFILATTDPQKIPATVVSRCQVVSFGKAQAPDITHALERIIAQEKMKIDADALSLIVDSADGSFRDAVKNLEQISFHKGTITVDVVRSNLGIGAHTARDTFLANILAHDTNAALGNVQNAVKEGIDIKVFLVDCLRELEHRLVDHVITKNTAGTIHLRTLIECFSDAYSQLRTSPIPELPLELAVVEYCEQKNEKISPIINTPLSVIPGLLRPSEASSEGGIRNPVPKLLDPDPLRRSEASSLAGMTKKEPSSEPISTETLGLITREKLIEHWKDVIDELKPFNHSVAGVMRSTRPKEVVDGIVTIEAFYKFHQEKLSEVKTREVIAGVLKKLFGEKVRVEVVLGKK
ncbi:MAG: DNA polymerase III subunit gamma/tau [Candidatus Gottesmanbacteria bacterium]|nr:DNA polymerase III subunit gamma/tau [Candidatus Gottesmanbacteria bacterium]